jgi:transposase
VVGTRVPHPAKPGRRATKVWQVPATTNAIIELAEQLACQGIQRVVVESTSDSWRAFLYLLEARGLVVWLAGARDARAPAGPAQDRQAGCGVAGQAQRAGQVAALVRPTVQIRRLREDTRLGWDLTAERTRQVQRLEQAAGWTP